jgi:hypothetical protein
MEAGPAAGATAAAAAAAAPVVSCLSQPVRERINVFFVMAEMLFFVSHPQARTWAASTFKRAYDDSKASTRQHQLLAAVENLINAYIRFLHYLYF